MRTVLTVNHRCVFGLSTPLGHIRGGPVRGPGSVNIGLAAERGGRRRLGAGQYVWSGRARGVCSSCTLCAQALGIRPANGVCPTNQPAITARPEIPGCRGGRIILTEGGLGVCVEGGGRGGGSKDRRREGVLGVGWGILEHRERRIAGCRGKGIVWGGRGGGGGGGGQSVEEGTIESLKQRRRQGWCTVRVVEGMGT